MVVGPGVISNSRTFGRSFGVSQLFFFSGIDSNKGRNFGAGNCCCRVVNGLFTTVKPFLRGTRVSRKEILPLHSVSMVNEMFVSIEFNVSWKADTSSFLMIQKLSSTYLFQIWTVIRHQKRQRLHYHQSRNQ